MKETGYLVSFATKLQEKTYDSNSFPLFLYKTDK